MSSVAVIGGGITGLTAAFRLRERGHAVTLFEASPRTGGVIGTVREGGYLAERGPNTILETSPRIGELIDDLGLGSRRLDSNPDAEARFILRRGQPVAMPTSPPSFFTCRLFSAKAKLRLLAEPFIKASPPDADENLADFVRRRLGQEFLDYAINPFVGGIYAGDPARLSVREAFPKLHALEQRYGSLIKGQIRGARERKRDGSISKQNAKKLSFDHGLQVLTDTLQQKLDDSVRLDSPVTRIEKNAAGLRVTTSSAHGTRTETFDAALLALPAHRLAKLDIGPADSPPLAHLAEIYYPPVASITLGFRRENVAHPLLGFGTLNPEIERINTLGTLFVSSLFPGRAPAGHVTLTSYLGGARSPELALVNREEIVALTLADLRPIYGITGEPTFCHHFAFPKAIPQYDVGYGRFKELMARCENNFPGLFIAGHSRDGISLSDSIVSGHEAAERIASVVGVC